jgi:hypothetical protein
MKPLIEKETVLQGKGGILPEDAAWQNSPVTGRKTPPEHAISSRLRTRCDWTGKRPPIAGTRNRIGDALPSWDARTEQLLTLRLLS